jgi:nucleoside-diphosphate-sugar epimerase
MTPMAEGKATSVRSRVVVLGGGGFIGRHFIETLRRDDTDIVIVDSLPPRFPLGARESIRLGDIRDPSTFEGLLAPGDRVLHLAAAHHDFGLSRATFFAVNAWGTELLVRAAAQAGVQDICFLSSVAVYGAGSGDHAEADPCVPRADYGESKLAAEQVLQRWAAGAPGRRLLTIRPSMTFGEYNFANMYGLIAQIRSGRYLSVGDGTNRKSIGYVGNLVQATLQLWRRPDRLATETFNYADKPDLTSRQLERVIASSLGRPLPPLRLPFSVARILVAPFDAMSHVTGRDLGISLDRVRKFAVDETVYNCDRIFSSGFTPACSLEEGIRRTVAWYVREGRSMPREVRRPGERADDAEVARPWLNPAEESLPGVAA